MDDRRACLCDSRHAAGERAAEAHSAVANVSGSHSQLLAAEHQHRHRHARRAAVPALAREALVDERTANQAIDDPHIRCLPDLFLRAYGLPHYLKFVQTPDLLVMLNEYNGVYRQVFTDGRPLPEARIRRGRGIRRPRGPATRW